MQFIDSATIVVQGGTGGNGSVNFRREKYISRGGPDGGNGGKGGNVFLVGEPNLNSLLDYKYRNAFKAEDGRSGAGSRKDGHGGKDLRLPVPLGTLIYNIDTQELIGEVLTRAAYLVAKGGEGGLGNNIFKSSVNRSPRRRTEGSLGEERKIGLELRLLVDVAVIGKVNSGKSSLLKILTGTHTEIAAYPFTTQVPHLAVMHKKVDLPQLAFADLPGLIEGAGEGRGLGNGFLKHALRSRILLHTVDSSSENMLADIAAVDKELACFSAEILAKPRWLIAMRYDNLTAEERRKKREELLRLKIPVFFIESTRSSDCEELCVRLYDFFLSERN